MSEFMNAAMIPGIVIAVCLFYGYRVLVLKDTKAIRNVKSRKLTPNENDEFCRKAGTLIILFALGTVLEFCLELFVSAQASMICCAVIVVAELIAWKKLADQFK